MIQNLFQQIIAQSINLKQIKVSVFGQSVQCKKSHAQTRLKCFLQPHLIFFPVDFSRQNKLIIAQIIIIMIHNNNYQKKNNLVLLQQANFLIKNHCAIPKLYSIIIVF